MQGYLVFFFLQLQCTFPCSVIPQQQYVLTVERVLSESSVITHITVKVIPLFGSCLYHAAGHMSKRWLRPNPSV